MRKIRANVDTWYHHARYKLSSNEIGIIKHHSDISTPIREMKFSMLRRMSDLYHFYFMLINYR